jgi:hypothetical protein
MVVSLRVEGRWASWRRIRSRSLRRMIVHGTGTTVWAAGSAGIAANQPEVEQACEQPDGHTMWSGWTRWTF